jgi:hypothetical protein
MSVGFVKPLTTCESVKPCGRFAAPWAGPLGKANKAPTQASNVSAISANGRRALLISISPFSSGAEIER